MFTNLQTDYPPTRKYILDFLENSTPRELISFSAKDEDNQPDHFFASFLTALRDWNANYAKKLLNDVSFYTFLAKESVLSDFQAAVQKKPLVFMIQNIQVLTNDTVENFLHQLLLRDIPCFQLLLISNKIIINEAREEFQIQYLSPEEEAEFYRNRGLILSNEEFGNIRSYTDGWISAVEMICELTRTHSTAVLSELTYYITEWIETKFFQQFDYLGLSKLILFSLLPEFSLDLIRHITGWYGKSLPYMMTTTPLLRFNEKTKCFHYARHLKPYMKEKQVILSNQQKQNFYLQVADWYLDQGDELTAIEYYLKIGSYHKIYSIMIRCIYPNTRKRAKCYIDAISSMPAAFLDEHPMLLVIQSNMLCTLSRYTDACYLMENFCRHHDLDDDTPGEIMPALGEAYLILATASIRGKQNHDSVIFFFKRACELLPRGSSLITDNINLYSDRPALFLLSPDAGSLKKSLETVTELEPYIRTLTHGGSTGISMLASAEYHFYTYNFAELENDARQAITAALSEHQYDIICSSYFLLMRYYFAVGDYQKTMESHHMVKQYGAETAYNDFFTIPDLADCWLMLKTGEKHKIARWLQDEDLYHKTVLSWNYGRDQIARAYYLLANREYEALLSYTVSAIQQFRSRGYHLLSIQLYVMQAAAYDCLGQKEKSAKAFESAYLWCHKNNIITPIIEYGNRIQPVLKNCRTYKQTEIPDEWLNEVADKSSRFEEQIKKFTEQYRKADVNENPIQ